MFKKIIIVDDIDAVNRGVESALKSLGVEEIMYSSYCDDAWLKIKRASLDKRPFDLIICDLSFLGDHRARELTSGQQLIEQIKVTYPDLSTIIFSVEEHPPIIKELWENVKVDAYICKDRVGLKELTKALTSIYSGNRYLPQNLKMLMQQSNTVLLTEHDELLMQLLSKGYKQNQIEDHFKKEGVTPASRSSIEKRLKDLREEFEASTNIQLVAILKDCRLI